MSDIVRLNLGIIKRGCDTCRYGWREGDMALRSDGSTTKCFPPDWLAMIERSCCSTDNHQDWEPMWEPNGDVDG